MAYVFKFIRDGARQRFTPATFEHMSDGSTVAHLPVGEVKAADQRTAIEQQAQTLFEALRTNNGKGLDSWDIIKASTAEQLLEAEVAPNDPFALAAPTHASPPSITQALPTSESIAALRKVHLHIDEFWKSVDANPDLSRRISASALELCLIQKAEETIKKQGDVRVSLDQQRDHSRLLLGQEHMTDQDKIEAMIQDVQQTSSMKRIDTYRLKLAVTLDQLTESHPDVARALLQKQESNPNFTEVDLQVVHDLRAQKGQAFQEIRVSHRGVATATAPPTRPAPSIQESLAALDLDAALKELDRSDQCDATVKPSTNIPQPPAWMDTEFQLQAAAERIAKIMAGKSGGDMKTTTQKSTPSYG